MALFFAGTAPQTPNKKNKTTEDKIDTEVDLTVYHQKLDDWAVEIIGNNSYPKINQIIKNVYVRFVMEIKYISICTFIRFKYLQNDEINNDDYEYEEMVDEITGMVFDILENYCDDSEASQFETALEDFHQCSGFNLKDFSETTNSPPS